MSHLSIIDESLNIEYSKNCILSIRISPDGFSFSILDSINKRVIALFHQDTFNKEPEFQLKKIRTIYDEVELLSYDYLNTRIFSLIPEKTTLVPKDVFVPYLTENFFRLAHTPSKNGKVMSSFIPTFKSYAIYEMYRPLIAFLGEKHQYANFYNELVASVYNIDFQSSFLKVTILKEQIVILAFDQDSTFYNSYYYEGENDLLYYTMGVVKNLKLDIDTIHLEGIINHRESIFHRFKQYFNKVNIVKTEAGLIPSLQQLPDSRFVSLFNSLL